MSEALNASLEIVVGLPGSGKSTLLEQQLADGEIDSYFDDYQRGAPEDDKSNPRKSPNYQALAVDIDAGKRVAIADIRYCVRPELSIVTKSLREVWPALAITVRYFENNAEACRQNVRTRARPDKVDRELQFIDKHSPEYQPVPEQTIPVIIG